MDSKRILLVENEAVSAKNLEKIIYKLGHDVVSIVTSGEDVVRYIENLHPDLILMDINLEGEIDGIEATAQVQAKIDIPVIYITAFDDESTLQRALITSPYNYLSKPVNEKTLSSAIEIAMHRHRIEKSFKEHEKWFDIIIKSIDNAVVITDYSGNVSYMNRKAEEITGWGFEDSIGIDHLSVLNFGSELSEKHIENPVSSALQYNITVYLPEKTFLISKSGSLTFVNGKAHPYTDDNGKIIGVILIITEIKDKTKDFGNKKVDLEKKIIERTVELMEEKIEREKAEESLHTSEEKYRKIVETSLEGIWLSDNNHNSTFINKKAADMLGYSIDELMNTRLTDHLEKNFKESFLKELEKKSIVSGDVRELLFKCKNGHSMWALVSTNILFDDTDNPVGFLSMITDINERKRAEKEIINAKLKAEESSKLKSILILNLNHELRTPMNGILGFTNLLKDDIKNPEHSEMLDFVYSSGKRLMGTLNSIMEYATLESGNSNPEIKNINLNDCIQKVLESMEIAAKEKKLNFFCKKNTDNITVKTDIEMLRSLLAKLADNAVKYTESGSVSVELDEYKNENEFYAQIKIIDTGIGIPDEKHSAIFEEFKQASEGYGRSHEGLGLGLSIVKRISEILNIKLSFTSHTQKGTVFIVRIPAVPSENKFKPLPRETEDISRLIDKKIKQGKTKNILVIEDNMVNVNLMIFFLNKIYNVDYANTGEKAIELAESNKFSLILTDINLGEGIDGIETQKRIRKINGYEKTPNIAVTGYSTPKDKNLALNEGFDDFISKPYTKQILIKTIENHLNR